MIRAFIFTFLLVTLVQSQATCDSHTCTTTGFELRGNAATTQCEAGGCTDDTCCTPTLVCTESFQEAVKNACKCGTGADEGTANKDQFCYGGSVKANARCSERVDNGKNVFYGAKVYGSWDSNTRKMSMTLPLPWDISLTSITWNGVTDMGLQYLSTDKKKWTVDDTTDPCKPTYTLDVPQTEFFGAGSKFKITGSQLTTTLHVVASEIITTVKNGNSYTYTRTIKNTVPVLVNLQTKTTVDVTFKTRAGPPGAPQDFVLFVGAEENMAGPIAERHVIIDMEVRSRKCIKVNKNTDTEKGVKVTVGTENIAAGKASEFTWEEVNDGSGDLFKEFQSKDNMCMMKLKWKFYPKEYKKNAYEITLEFEMEGEVEQPKFTTDVQIDIKEADVLADVGFTTSIDTYSDEDCTKAQDKFNLGSKFYTKIVLSHMIIDAETITCNTYVVKQTKGTTTTDTDMKAENKYNFMEKSPGVVNTHICGAELESHHFHVSVEGYDTTLETEIVITYKQGRRRRFLVETKLTRSMFNNPWDEYALAEPNQAELDELDEQFRKTPRSPDTDDMVVNMYIEAEEEIAGLFSAATSAQLKNMGFMLVFVGLAGFAFGYSRKYSDKAEYVSMPLVEMQE